MAFPDSKKKAPNIFFDVTDETGIPVVKSPALSSLTQVITVVPATPTPTPVNPTVGPLIIPPQVVGDPPYLITDPTSDSSGAWSYVSNDLSIGIIDGQYFIAVAPGIVDVIGTQEPADNFTSAERSTTVPVTEPAPMVLTVQIGYQPTFEIPAYASFGILADVRVDWGDGIVETFSNTAITHNYSHVGTFTIMIYGYIGYYGNYASPPDNRALISIDSFGDSHILSLAGACSGATNLVSVPTILPLTVTDIQYMFTGCNSFDQNLNTWDTSNVTNMSNLFSYCPSYNQPLNLWNTISVTNMSYMFSGSGSFNQPIGTWNTSSVTNMTGMFVNAASFNQDISSWDVFIIPTKPVNFDINCPINGTAKEPHWGS